MLILLRHGQTTANAQALLQGHMNLPLDPEGERQAQRSGEYLRATFPDALVISSPLTRAHQTALAVSNDVVIDERFIELDYGQWDGIALTDVDAQSWADWRADPGFRPPGGETLVELDARVRPALDEIAERAQHGHVIVVSHVSPIKSGVTWALGVGPEVSWRCQLDRASICRIAISPRGPSLVALNDTSHL
ncbi:MAG: histidine phosphatase family protein [Ilumatobacteraceae bacterium]|jgi:broad specificity phosphatase PhoE